MEIVPIRARDVLCKTAGHQITELEVEFLRNTCQEHPVASSNLSRTIQLWLSIVELMGNDGGSALR